MYDWSLNTLFPQKIKFSIKDFFRKWADFVTFTGEILNRKLHFCAVILEASVAYFTNFTRIINHVGRN